MKDVLLQEYEETEQSKMLWKMNQERLIFYKAPNEIVPNNILEFVWKYLYRFLRCGHRYIFARHIYDIKQKESAAEYEMKVEKYSGTIPKIAIYTCISGGYDNLSEPVYRNEYMDFFVVTEADIPQKSMWKKIDLNSIDTIRNLDRIRQARYIKLHPHELFPEYEYSLWVDGNVCIMADVMPMLLAMISSGKNFGCHLHPHRNKLKTEAKAISSLKRTVENDKMIQQVSDYYRAGYTDECNIFETTILLRKHNDKEVRKLMSDWWYQIKKYTTRDQLSLPYVLWLNKLSISDMYILGHNLKLNPRIRYLEHRSK